MVEHFLRQFDPRDVVIVTAAITLWLSGKRSRESLRLHGVRLGLLGSRINRVESHLGLPPPALGHHTGGEGNGE